MKNVKNSEEIEDDDDEFEDAIEDLELDEAS